MLISAGVNKMYQIKKEVFEVMISSMMNSSILLANALSILIKMNLYQKTNDEFIFDHEFTLHVAVQSHLFYLIHFIDKTKTQFMVFHKK